MLQKILFFAANITKIVPTEYFFYKKRKKINLTVRNSTENGKTGTNFAVLRKYLIL